jgi:hypothetical protein
MQVVAHLEGAGHKATPNWMTPGGQLLLDVIAENPDSGRRWALQLSRSSAFTSSGADSILELGAPGLRRRVTAAQGWEVVHVQEPEWLRAKALGGDKTLQLLGVRTNESSQPNKVTEP